MQLTNYFNAIYLPPLFPVAASFIIGIIFYTTLLSMPLTLCGTVLCAALYTMRINYANQITLCFIFALAGAHLHQKELHYYDSFYTFIDKQKITVSGTVIDKSEVVINHQKLYVTTIATKHVAIKENVRKCNKLMLFYEKNNNDACVGDEVRIENICCKKPLNTEFQQYQMKEGIIATVFADRLHYHIDYHPKRSLRFLLWSHKKRLLETVQRKFSPHTFNFFSSLFLGNRTCIKHELEETNEQFKTWGISHFLARSGLHLALFVAIWHTALRTIPLPLFIKQLLLMLLGIIYFLFSWTSTPFTRSFALFLLSKICFFSRTPFHLLHYLTLTCFIFLLYCPLYLFFLDFQLTFVLTCALAWFNLTTQHHESTRLKS